MGKIRTFWIVPWVLASSWVELGAVEILKAKSLSAINSDRQDFSPTFTPDGKTMVFSSNRDSQFSHLYYSKLNNNLWSKPVFMARVNSGYNDETPFITADGKLLLFASDRAGSTEVPRDGKGQIKVSFDLYVAKWDGETWSNPQPLGDVNSAWHEKSPSMSRDGKILFWSSWPFGEMARARIRMLRLDGRATQIEDIPAQINSRSQETALVPGEREGIYYFSSRRPGGKGGWDIYRTLFDGATWSEPTLLEGNVNTDGDEAFLTVSNGYYYISSTLSKDKKDYDLNIESISDQPINAASWRFRLVDADTKIPLAGDIELQMVTEDGERVSDPLVTSTNLQNPGSIIKPATLNRVDLARLKGVSKGYLPNTLDTPLSTLEQGVYNIPLKKIEKNASFTVRSIHFDFDSAALKKSSEASLNMVADFLKQNPSAHLEIVGHTDLNGSVEYNQELSQKRALAVKQWLTQHGIDGDRLRSRGVGKRQPITARKGKLYDAQNRRTEFVLTHT